MPDKRKHRGPHPADAELFSAEQLPALRDAVADLSWLLSRGYAPRASLKLVGDRAQLTERQRLAVLRSACSDASLQARKRSEVPPDEVAGRAIAIDGFNLLTTIEAALAGGVILIGRDGCFRDMASMHGSFRKVAETKPALELIGGQLRSLSAGACLWLFDQPVSNSGRIGKLAEEIAAANGWHWRFELAIDPDGLLRESADVVISADSQVIDRCRGWFNLAAHIVAKGIPVAWVVDLSSR